MKQNGTGSVSEFTCERCTQATALWTVTGGEVELDNGYKFTFRMRVCFMCAGDAIERGLEVSEGPANYGG